MDFPGFLSGRESGGGLSGFRPRCIRAAHVEFGAAAISTAMGAEAAARLIEPRAETLNSVGGCRLQARGAKPSTCFCAAQPSGKVSASNTSAG